MVSSVTDTSFWELMFPEGWESFRYHLHPDLVDQSFKEAVFPAEHWGWFNPVPDDRMDYVFGVGAVVVVIGGIAYFGNPAMAGVFIAEPGTMTATFATGVALSNYLQSKF